MKVFPQIAQYPFIKTQIRRTVINELADGSTVRLADPSASGIEWTMTFRDLCDEEAKRLETFFVEVEGALGRFTFVDPLGNLLFCSETLDAGSWEHSDLLDLAGGKEDAFKGTAGWRLANLTGAELDFEQTINAPGCYRYNFSLWVRAEDSATLILRAGLLQREVAVGPSWQRVHLTCPGSDSTVESVTFGIRLPSPSCFDVFGPMVAAQDGPSKYVPSTGQGAAYERARLANNSLDMLTTGPNRHSCTLRIIHGHNLRS